MIGFLLLLDIILLVMFIIMFFDVISMRKTLEKLAAQILPPPEAHGAAEGDGGEIFQGYRIPPEVAVAVREYMAEGVMTKAEDELARGTSMPRSVARIYLSRM